MCRSSAKWETFVRLRRDDTRECGSCHGLNTYLSRKPNFTGIDLGGVSGTVVTNLTWDLIKRLRDTVKVKLVLKGILAFEDAKLATEAGIDAIVVSNHGGRVEDGVGATIDVLPEIVEAVGGRMPVLVDSGFRRGSDIVKALALGAQAVCVGRPYLWGLGAFGQPGVERVLAILRAETRNAMAQLGAPSVKDLSRRWCGGFRGFVMPALRRARPGHDEKFQFSRWTAAPHSVCPVCYRTADIAGFPSRARTSQLRTVGLGQ